MLISRSFIFLVGLLSMLPATALAGVLDLIREDFRPISGYVIMPVDDAYLIDLDADKGIRVGDLFAVVQEGKTVVHPVTNEVLGTLDEVRNVLQVTRIKSGYSYARPVGEDGPIAKSTIVQRYSQLPATFWDYTGQGEVFYSELKTVLPQLEWPEYDTAQARRPASEAQPVDQEAMLYFLLRPDGLQVRGPDFEVLKAYPLPQTVQVETGRITAAPPTPPTPTTAPPSLPKAQPPVAWERGGDRVEGGLPAFPDYQSLGTLPDGTVMADFVEAEGELLLAATNGRDVQVFTVGETLSRVASGDTSLPGEFLSVHWWRPSPEGPLYLATTQSVELNEPGILNVGHKPVGTIFRLADNELVPVRERLNYILGSFDYDRDGRKEMLLGQEFDSDIFFGNVKELHLIEGEFQAREFSYPLPRLFAVQGSVLGDLTGDGVLDTATVYKQSLFIYSEEERLFSAGGLVGGSLSQMEYYPNPGLEEADLATQAFPVPPVTHDFDADGIPELVVVGSEGNLVRTPGVGPGVEKAWLTVFKYRDDMFVKGKIGQEVDFPIQGFHLGNGKIFLVVTESPSLLGQEGRSYLISFPLQ